MSTSSTRLLTILTLLYIGYLCVIAPVARRGSWTLFWRDLIRPAAVFLIFVLLMLLVCSISVLHKFDEVRAMVDRPVISLYDLILCVGLSRLADWWDRRLKAILRKEEELDQRTPLDL